jgi:DNA-binding FadR family transcriptional regulator
MLLDYRRLIESETARRAATLATPIEVRAMRVSAELSLAAGKAVDAEAFARADAQFHDAVSVAAHNVFLRSSVVNIRRLMSQSDVLLFHGDMPGSLEVAGTQHLGIVEAIAVGEPDTAAELMTAHIDTTQNQFERRIRNRLFNLTGHPRHPSAADERSSKSMAASQPPSPETSVS